MTRPTPRTGPGDLGGLSPMWVSEFTVASIAVYHLHDIVHHANDVDHG